jgi:cytochrome P450
VSNDTRPVADCVKFVVGALFAGQLNSGINAAWVLCYLATNSHWLNEVRKEVQATTDKWCPSDAPLVDRLGRLPLEAWEQGFPLIDLCLKDTIRLQLHGTGFRKNMSGKPLKIGNEYVPADGFLV